MIDVITAITPGLYVDQGMAHTSATYDTLMSQIERSQLPYRTARAGQSFSLGEEVQIEIIHPQDALLRNTRSDLNSNSVVLRITHDEVCILLTGDAEPDTEETLLRKGITPCQVLKVAHHGSGYSTSDAWLRAIQPAIAVVSAGSRNRYGHPDPDTMGRLESMGVEVYRTDIQGEILLRSDGKNVQIEARPKARRAPEVVTDNQVAAPQPAVNVNTANANELEALPGIGEVKAAAIIEWRSANGPFQALSDLDAVPGIGPATLAKLEPVVVF
jgi:comEA protein